MSSRMFEELLKSQQSLCAPTMLLFFIVINEIKSWYQNGIKSMYASHKMRNFLQEEPHIAQFLTHELCMSLIYVTLLLF